MTLKFTAQRPWRVRGRTLSIEGAILNAIECDRYQGDDAGYMGRMESDIGALKTMAATLISRLVDRGVLDADDLQAILGGAVKVEKEPLCPPGI